jgi:hypothetical protein
LNESALAGLPENWAAHGTSSVSSAKIQQVYYTADQDVQSATGCSIDASVEFIQLRTKYKVDLLDKMNVTFKLGEHIAHAINRFW